MTIYLKFGPTYYLPRSADSAQDPPTDQPTHEAFSIGEIFFDTPSADPSDRDFSLERYEFD